MATPHGTSNLYHTDNLQVPASQVVVIYTEWNKDIVLALLDGAKRILAQFPQVQVNSYVVPGAVEITHAIASHHREVGADAYIAFACIIRGETPHFDYVCQSVTQGITSLNLNLPAPVIYGILTVNDMSQAMERIGGLHGHKGEEAAMAALNMISLNHTFQQESSFPA